MSAITKPEWRRRCIAHLRQAPEDAAQENIDREREP